MSFKTRINKLNNGAQYILSDAPNSQSITILILFRYGAGFDQLGKSGMAHLLEHLIFKGTDKRPNTKDIMMELNSFGAEYNAFTSKIFTGYHAKCPHMYINNCLDVLTDMVKNPKFLHMKPSQFQEEFEQEKKIVLQELLSIRDQYQRYIHELLEKNIFVSPLDRNAEDDINDIESITVNNVIETYKKYYNANNMIISIHGNLNDLSKVENLIHQYFDDIPSGYKNTLILEQSKNIDDIKHIDILKKSNLSKCHISIAYPNRGYEDIEKYYLTELFSLVFANLTSGRLFQNIREKEGLVYTIRANNFCYDHLGYFSIQTNTNHKNLEIVLSKIKNEIDEVINNGITNKEFELVKKNYCSKLLLNSEDSITMAMHNAYELFYNSKDFMNIFDVIQCINNFTLDKMNIFIKELLSKKNIITIIK